MELKTNNNNNNNKKVYAIQKLNVTKEKQDVKKFSIKELYE